MLFQMKAAIHAYFRVHDGARAAAYVLERGLPPRSFRTLAGFRFPRRLVTF
jgi:hypothetical protein